MKNKLVYHTKNFTDFLKKGYYLQVFNNIQKAKDRVKMRCRELREESNKEKDGGDIKGRGTREFETDSRVQIYRRIRGEQRG